MIAHEPDGKATADAIGPVLAKMAPTTQGDQVRISLESADLVPTLVLGVMQARIKAVRMKANAAARGVVQGAISFANSVPKEKGGGKFPDHVVALVEGDYLVASLLLEGANAPIPPRTSRNGPGPNRPTGCGKTPLCPRAGGPGRQPHGACGRVRKACRVGAQGRTDRHRL